MITVCIVYIDSLMIPDNYFDHACGHLRMCVLTVMTQQQQTVCSSSETVLFIVCDLLWSVCAGVEVILRTTRRMNGQQLQKTLVVCICVYVYWVCLRGVCVFITVGPSTKLCAWGQGDIGGHLLRETTSRGLCVCPSRTSECGGEGDCVKEGGGGEGERKRERALERLRCYSPGH
jgi:hypothetical protein